MKNKNLIIYRVATVLLSLLIVMGASMYILDHENVVKAFEALGFPTELIYFMATAKFLGVIALWQTKSKVLQEWAYAGFVYNLLLAVFAHINVGDGEQWGAVAGLIFLAISYFFRNKVAAQQK
ncbi:DoxX family protein [Flammeovirga pectinis]|uniref:DoxX family protein n=1 Tax=Flammeovirga pectinis TaxID=2494373 RepID=A0A3Q9FP21_9BACT|nr:DoxX family protein [Flammeovirga pectinis]AZQ63085.1 DoxX family protein [Flammeovirga pectinis]